MCVALRLITARTSVNSQQCYSCQEYGQFASECPWNGCPFDDEFPKSCNPDEEMTSEPALAMDVEPSMKPAVTQTPPINHAILPPPLTRPKKPAGKVFKPTENGWEEVFSQNVPAKKVKYGQAKLKLNWSKDTVTQDIAVRHSQVSKGFMFCCYNVMMSYGFNKNVDNLKRIIILVTLKRADGCRTPNVQSGLTEFF